MITLKLRILLIALLSFSIIASNCVFAEEKKSALPVKPEHKSETAKSVQGEVDKKVKDKAAEKHKEIVSEAVDALNETRNALKLLGEDKAKESLAALERVTGKLELILARDPELAFAPVEFNIETQDLFANLDTVKMAIKEAEDFLEDGEIQKARPIVASLASEIVFRTVSIPLTTYPDAIKAVAPLIDEGKFDEAKAALQAVLNTLVVTTDSVIPLPVLRAKKMLKNAEELVEKKDRTAEDSKKLAKLMSEARKQLKLAELLGYGTKKSFNPMYEQLSQIEEKITGGKSGKGWFDNIKQQLSDLI